MLPILSQKTRKDGDPTDRDTVRKTTRKGGAARRGSLFSNICKPIFCFRIPLGVNEIFLLTLKLCARTFSPRVEFALQSRSAGIVPQRRQVSTYLPVPWRAPLLLICGICWFSRADHRYDFTVAVIERKKFLIVDASNLGWRSSVA